MRVVAVCYEGLATFEFGIVSEVFGIPRPEFQPNWYAFETCAVVPGDMVSSSGLHFAVTASLSALDNADTVIVPGWSGVDDPVPDALCEALRSAHRRGARIVSICTGAFVLAASGLLTGRRATTHWRYTRALKECDPAIKVMSDVLYVDDGDILTSAGSAAGIDLCLHLVRSDFGIAHANHVARRLVVPTHREGAQAQLVERPVLTAAEGPRLGALLDYLRLHLDRPHAIADMAQQVGMSERTFARRFRDVTGIPPGEWLLRERLSLARELLETTTLGVEPIAYACGLGSNFNLRHHFRQRFGMNPTHYRASRREGVLPASDACY